MNNLNKICLTLLLDYFCGRKSQLLKKKRFSMLMIYMLWHNPSPIYSTIRNANMNYTGTMANINSVTNETEEQHGISFMI